MSFYDQLLKRLDQLRNNPGYMMQLDLEIGRAPSIQAYLGNAQQLAIEEASRPTIKGETLAQIRAIILRDERRVARQ
jgi:hypothetical protein